MAKDIIISSDTIKDIMVDAVGNRVRASVEGYKSPFDKHIQEAIQEQEENIKQAIHEAVSSAVKAPTFKKGLVEALNHKLANLVINRCSGLVEKSFNDIMQDAVLRNKLQAAVIKIIEVK